MKKGMRVRRPSVADIRNKQKKLKKLNVQLTKAIKHQEALTKKLKRLRIKRFT